MKELLCVLVMQMVVTGVFCSTWSYENVIDWGELEGSYCDGKRQSPIDIVRSQVQVDRDLGTFRRNLFSAFPRSMEVVNNGHSLQVNVEGGYKIDDRTLLPSTYTIAQFHFHWASSSRPYGSEHTINGRGAFGEMHIVHLRDSAGDEVLTRNNGLAVLGFFIQPTLPWNNTAFEKVLSYARQVRYGGESVTVDTVFPISDLLPRRFRRYYRYRGSLTTPSCNQVVLWTVFQKPMEISYEQKLELQQLLYDGEEGEASNHLIGDNFRPTQSLNGRLVTRPTSHWKK